MPIYSYKCLSCGRVQEVLVNNDEDIPIYCEKCDGALKKMITPVNFQLKGQGWAGKEIKQNKPSTIIEGKKRIKNIIDVTKGKKIEDYKDV